MKPILISCIPILALAAFQCSAAEELMSTAAPASSTTDPDPVAAIARVKQALQNIMGTAAGKISVSSHADIIIITGKAGSEAEAARIKTTAATAAAGMRVSSQIEVDADKADATQQKSAQLVKDVEDALHRDNATTRLSVLISVDDQQKISLFGPVPTAQDRVAAERVAARVPGVRRIENHLSVPE